MELHTVDTPPGRWMATRARAWSGGHPIVGVQPDDLVAAGVRRAPRVAGVRGGKPMLEDGRALDVESAGWCTGFVHDDRWIKLPVLDANGGPVHHRGVVPTAPGLYFATRAITSARPVSASSVAIAPDGGSSRK